MILPRSGVVIDVKPVLTKKQETVRRMLVDEGLTTAQVMARLNVAEGTVKNHLTSLYKAYGVKSRYELLYKELTKKLKEKGVEL